ncbi:MAG TPA: c-type cytochrome, partial [Opitutaceae bacterium]|nr:c-type cytochrome [Opitutaceae bacterium]
MTSARADRDAASVYAQYCAACHGADLQGGKVPSLLDDRWKQGSDDESLRKSIEEGIVTSGMPAFKQALTEAEVRALIVFIRESAKRTKEPIPERSRELPAATQSSEEHRYRIELVAGDLDVPWSMVFLPDGRLLFTERKGELYLAEQIPSGE